MAYYNITSAQRTTLENRIADAKSFLETRRQLWVKLPLEVRLEWQRRADIPDPVVDKLYRLYLYLKKFFEES